MNVLLTICARGGSKGLPGKNIRTIANKPLIAYSILVAQKFVESFAGTAVLTLSTDSPEIRSIAAQYNLKTDYLRPEAFATDKISKTPALQDILKYEEHHHQLQFDYLIDLDITSPLRTIVDIQTALDSLHQDKEAINLVTVNSAHRNPYFNMLEQQENGYFSVSKKPTKPFYSRQDAPKVYDMNSSFYIFSSAYFKNNYNGSLTDKTMIYEIPHVCFDVDSLEDFEYLEYMIHKGKWTF